MFIHSTLLFVSTTILLLLVLISAPVLVVSHAAEQHQDRILKKKKNKKNKVPKASKVPKKGGKGASVSVAPTEGKVSSQPSVARSVTPPSTTQPSVLTPSEGKVSSQPSVAPSVTTPTSQPSMAPSEGTVTRQPSEAPSVTPTSQPSVAETSDDPCWTAYQSSCGVGGDLTCDCAFGVDSASFFSCCASPNYINSALCVTAQETLGETCSSSYV